MAIIKSGHSTDQMKVDAVSNAARVTLYDSNGNEVSNTTNETHVDVSLSALNATQLISLDGYNGISFTLLSLGHANNVISVEQSLDEDVTWIPATIINASTNNTLPSITAVGSYTIRFTGGVSSIRIRVSSYTSGTVLGTLTASVSISQNIVIRGYDSVYSEFNSSSVQLAAGATYTGAWEADLAWQGVSQSIFSDQPMTIVFEQSNDGATAHHTDTNTYDANSTSQDGSRLYNLISNYHRVKVTNNGAAPTTTFFINTYNTPNWAPIPGRSLTESGNQRSEVPEKPTYRATFAGTPVATATFTIKGSATKTIKVTKIGFSQSATATTMIDVSTKKYSNIAGGTPATVTGVPLDSGFAAATAVVQSWAGGTPGTQTVVGTLQTHRYRSSVAGDNFAVSDLSCEFGNTQRGASALTLRGVNQWAGIDLSAVPAGAACDIWIEWTED